jgi:hypothetical protein
MITFSLVLGLLLSLATSNPCDIYASGGTPCVCAHSTVRALFQAYHGNLYQVQRQSDRATLNIGTLQAGGHANATAQDDFCTHNTACLITIIYDQTTNGNHLTVGTPGGANNKGNTAAVATAESITINGNKVYSIFTRPGQGYFHDGSRSGIPTGTDAEGIYMVTSGTHVNNGCCFDYGNAESNRLDNGASHMDAIYFGTMCAGCPGGSGPYVQADLENGLFGGGSTRWNPNQRAFKERFVTAMEKNDGRSRFSLKGGNAQMGTLTSLYNGELPNGYTPMHKEGGIILGTGGDDSSWSEGTFYEGAMVRGFPSDQTEDSVQQNIVSAGYGK